MPVMGSVQPSRRSVAVRLSTPVLLSAFANAPIGVAVLTPQGVISDANRRVGELLGREVEDLVGGTFFDVTHPDDLPLARHNCSLMAEGLQAVVRHECRFVRADQEVVWVLVSTSRVEQTDQEQAHLIMHVEDITDRKYLESRLVHQALHDPLTGVGNRAELERALLDLPPHGGPDSLLLLDLDGFKTVNDTYGHHAGDLLLSALATRLSSEARPGDVVVRLGGDEFAVLCPDTDRATAGRLAAGLREAVRSPFSVDEHVLEVRAAVGVATLARHVTDQVDPAVRMTALLRDADHDMYADKGRSTGPVDRRGPS
jgi:diguanylate cyclase (GGDEF)-like protein/PAS domain S-box-containing protein